MFVPPLHRLRSSLRLIPILRLKLSDLAALYDSASEVSRSMPTT